MKDGFAVTRAVDQGLTEPLTTNDGIRFALMKSTRPREALERPHLGDPGARRTYRAVCAISRPETGRTQPIRSDGPRSRYGQEEKEAHQEEQPGIEAV